MKRTKRLKASSTKRAKELRIYSKTGKAWLLAHPSCEVCRTAYATQIHHKAGRIGPRLNDSAFWLAVCNGCHYKITTEGKWAKANGFSL